ncbi:DUF1007 family protein [Halodurantibacterium flavum]|uniref:DUF1007 family protein n=1 Tax=Halodurantibacterium flavum TaxID=1382802 RepID=A0ABW4S5T3_9RHOB
MRVLQRAVGFFCVGLSVLISAPAVAHPHIYIDTGLQMQFDDEGRLAAIRVVWVYDAFYSMLLLEEMGLDPDFTGTVTEEERATLAGFDMDWIEGYEGDLYLLQGERALALSGPMDWTADVQDGRIISTHIRALQERVEPGPEPVILQAYDPTYYTAYTIAIDPVIEGRTDCDARIFEPDFSAASEILESALAEMLAQPGYDELEDFPAVGAAFADEIRLTCGA